MIGSAPAQLNICGLANCIAALLGRALTLNKLAQQADGQELERGHHHQHAKHQQGTIADWSSADKPEHCKVAECGKSNHAKDHRSPAENMQRARGKSGVQHDAHQVESAFEQAAHAILGFAKLPGPVIDRHFGNAKALPMQQDWDEPMQLAIQGERLQSFAAIGLEAAVKIVQTHTAEAANHTVKYFGWQGLVDRVMADMLPA